MSCLTVALVDTLSSLPKYERVIPGSKVYELLFKVHDTLDNAVSKQVGNSAHILAHVFNSASRQFCGVWASQFPFLHGLKDVVPSSEACLYGYISWSLAQAQQQSSMGLSQSFPLREVAKPGHGPSSISLCKRGLCQGLVVTLWIRGLTWRAGLRLIQVARSLLVVVSLLVLLMLGRRGLWGSMLQMCHSPWPPPHLHLWFFRLVCFPIFWINRETLLLIGLCLILFRVTIFSLGHALPCSIDV